MSVVIGTAIGKRALLSVLVSLNLSLAIFTANAQSTQGSPSSTSLDSSDEEVTHTELRALRDELLVAWQHRDVDAMLAHVAPNVVVTWQNGEVSRGPAGLRKFYDEILTGNDKLIKNIVSTINVDDLSILYGNSFAIAFGSIHDNFTLNHSILRAAFLGSGDTLALDSRWTATLVKLEGHWRIAAYHVSTDAFSNPILAKAVAAGTRSAEIAGAVAFGLGVLVMWLLLRRQSRNSKSDSRI